MMNRKSLVLTFGERKFTVSNHLQPFPSPRRSLIFLIFLFFITEETRTSSGRRRRFRAGDLRRPHTPIDIAEPKSVRGIHSAGWAESAESRNIDVYIKSSVVKMLLCDTEINSNLCNLTSQITLLCVQRNQIHT